MARIALHVQRHGPFGNVLWYTRDVTGVLPPSAVELAAKLSDELIRRAGGPMLLTSKIGVGRTAILNQIADNVMDRGEPVIWMLPPREDLDGPAHALGQGAAGLREYGVNGVLDPIHDPTVTFERKLDALRRGLAAFQGSAVVLFDLPDSWSRSSHEQSDGGTVALRGHRIIHEILQNPGKNQILLVSTRSPPGLSLRLDQRDFEVDCEGPSLLSSAVWGSSTATAERLAEVLPANALKKLTGLEMRVAIALATLGMPDRVIERTIVGGFAEIRRKLIDQVSKHPWLAEAFLVLGELRFPVATSLKDRLLDLCVGDVENHRKLLDDVLLIEEGHGWALHPRLHLGARDLYIPPQRASVLLQQANAELARGWMGHVGDDWQAAWHTTVAKWESLHHWAEANNEERLTDIPDVSILTVLGRRRSLDGDFGGAVQAFRKAIDISPAESYAHEYLGYNLDRQGKDLRAAEAAFRTAVELEPANPWWNRRLIQALQRRGKIDAAWTAWLHALHDVVGSEDVSVWLQQHLHVGVARGFLDSGDAEKAASVLESVERERWCREFGGLYNIAQHWREAQDLEASVFPEHIRFEDRWNGPWLGDDKPRSWYPGRIVTVEEGVVIIEFAEPPPTGESPQICTLTLESSEFRSLAALPSDALIEDDCFIEIHVSHDDRRRILFHPDVRPLSLDDPLDLLQSWRR